MSAHVRAGPLTSPMGTPTKSRELVNIARYLTLAADVSDQIILIFF